MNPASSIASAAPSPPGTHSTSQRSAFARSARRVKTSPSASMSRPPSEATVTSAFGVRTSTWCGPMKSRWVTPG